MIKKVSNVLIPSILNFSDAASFFENLLALNKERSAPLSGRKISEKLGWPTSLIVDIVKKRKPLTPQRAIEFSRFTGMNSLELERLIWIALMETGDQQTKFFIQEKLGQDPSQVLSLTSSPVESSIYFYVDLVVGILLHENKKLSAEEVKTKLNGKRVSLKKIKEALTYIKKNQILEWQEDRNLFQQKKGFHFDNHNLNDRVDFVGIDIHRDYAENFIDFIQSPTKPSVYISGCFTITKAQFTPIALQLFQFKNWLARISDDNRNLFASEGGSSEATNLRLMQLDLNFFKVTKD